MLTGRKMDLLINEPHNLQPKNIMFISSSIVYCFCCTVKGATLSAQSPFSIFPEMPKRIFTVSYSFDFDAFSWNRNRRSIQLLAKNSHGMTD
jgi:hypothetical protein